MNTLADFKRYLAKPEAQVKMIELSWDGELRPIKNPDWRGVRKLQTNAVQFENGSWIHFSKASEWSFEPGKVINESHGIRIVYEVKEEMPNG